MCASRSRTKAKLPIIPSRRTSRFSPPQDRELRLPHQELARIAARYDKFARNFLAAASLINALYWIRLPSPDLVLPLTLIAEEALVPQRPEMAHRMRGAHQRHQATTRPQPLPISG